MKCLFIKSTFSLEIIYSIITAFRFDWQAYRFRPMGILRCVIFRFLMCCRQSLLSFRMPGNLNPRKGEIARSLKYILLVCYFAFCELWLNVKRTATLRTKVLHFLGGKIRWLAIDSGIKQCSRRSRTCYSINQWNEYNWNATRPTGIWSETWRPVPVFSHINQSIMI
jgi:hypothetical protein